MKHSISLAKRQKKSTKKGNICWEHTLFGSTICRALFSNKHFNHFKTSPLSSCNLFGSMGDEEPFMNVSSLPHLKLAQAVDFLAKDTIVICTDTSMSLYCCDALMLLMVCMLLLTWSLSFLLRVYTNDEHSGMDQA